ncbi:MAG TPA: PD-(D/E)XK nuclease family protein [Actinomycetes bacterium]|nr:PD-(D/E)XK nuclease family protein [Actinomycetes bacterium]
MSGVLQDGPYWLSPTKISMALGCPLRAQRRYKLKLREKPALPAFRGNQLHAALEATKGRPDLPGVAHLTTEVREAWQFNAPPPWTGLFSQWLALHDDMAPQMAELDSIADRIKTDAEAGRRKGGAQAPRMTNDYRKAEADLIGPWRDTIDSLRAAERELLDDPERSPWEATTRSGFDEYQSSLDTAHAYTAWWHNTPADDRPEILHCERRFETLLDRGHFKLGGRVDRIDLDPVRDALVVVDYKTGSGNWSKHERWIQAACYALGVTEVIGQRPDLVRFIDLDKGPSTDTYPVKPMWDIKLLDTCRYARDLIEGPPVATFGPCGICSYTDLCFDLAGNGFQFQALEDLEQPAAEEVTPA